MDGSVFVAAMIGGKAARKAAAKRVIKGVASMRREPGREFNVCGCLPEANHAAEGLFGVLRSPAGADRFIKMIGEFFIDFALEIV